LAEVLQTHDHATRVAYDGPSALQAAAELVPDVVLLDIGLPVMDGYELATRLRDLDGPPIRMIAVTGYGQQSDRARAQAAGFGAHFVKPVDFDMLLSAVERLAEEGLPALRATEVP
jgi:CheY-like chemotaxis protein